MWWFFKKFCCKGLRFDFVNFDLKGSTKRSSENLILQKRNIERRLFLKKKMKSFILPLTNLNKSRVFKRDFWCNRMSQSWIKTKWINSRVCAKIHKDLQGAIKKKKPSTTGNNTIRTWYINYKIPVKTYYIKIVQSTQETRHLL